MRTDSWTFDKKSGTLKIYGTGGTDYDLHSYFCPNPPWYRYTAKVKKVVIQDRIIGINVNTRPDKSDFAIYPKLTEIELRDSVKHIGYNAFSGCKRLTSVTIPDSVTLIGYCAFSGCIRLTSITIPNSVTDIYYGAFSDCKRLAYINIPKSVKYINSSLFEHCTSLTSIIIPDGVTEISFGAFMGCKQLTSVFIPKSVTDIETMSFLGSDNLTIYGERESEAETYATLLENIPFVEGQPSNATVKPKFVTHIFQKIKYGCIDIFTYLQCLIMYYYQMFSQ